MDNKYIKVTYQSNPIGKEKIILYLTTFDVEAFERDEQMQHIPEQKIVGVIDFDKRDINKPEFIEILENKIKDFINKNYASQLENMRSFLEAQKALLKAPSMQPKKIIKGDVVNADKVECDIIEGDVWNCNHLKCKEIHGQVINCDK